MDTRFTGDSDNVGKIFNLGTGWWLETIFEPEGQKRDRQVDSSFLYSTVFQRGGYSLSEDRTELGI
jgi:hypothetical protein